jgi:hypothetical protein
LNNFSFGETDKSKTVAEICELLSGGQIDAAKEVAQLKLASRS